MLDTFIFHLDWLDDELDEETQAQYLIYIFNYAKKGIEPNLKGIEKAYWNKIRKQIDFDVDRRIAKTFNGSKGGRPTKKNEEITDFSQANGIENTIEDEIFENTENLEKPNETNENLEKPNETNENLYVNVNVNGNANESGNVNVAKSIFPHSPNSPSEKYSQVIFEIFKNSNFPCANKNPLSFFQRDFKNAMQYLHSVEELKCLNSDDVIGACKNYIQVVNNTKCYFKQKYSFDRFVQIKNFLDFIPDNFRLENFLKFGEEVTGKIDTASSEKVNNFFVETKAPQYCENPKCNHKKLLNNFYVKAVICENCGNWAEYQGNKWIWQKNEKEENQKNELQK